MSKIKLLAEALDYIENHLEEDIRTDDVARACFCSRSTLEKMFKCINHITIREYLIRRRMMKAARDLWSDSETGILEIAIKYGYQSNEAFTRAFKQVWFCQPSEFRKIRNYTELFPRLKPFEDGDVYMNTRKQVDISELYDLFLKRRNCYFICCDIKNLMLINEVSHKAGDLAILEALRRIQKATGTNDVVFRIGGDEFVVLTDSTDQKYADGIVQEIVNENGKTFEFEEKTISLDLHVGLTRISKTPLKYDELFTELHTTIRNVKN